MCLRNFFSLYGYTVNKQIVAFRYDSEGDLFDLFGRIDLEGIEVCHKMLSVHVVDEFYGSGRFARYGIDARGTVPIAGSGYFITVA